MPFPVDAQYIKQTEEKLGVRFPLSYVAYMRRCNGGEIKVSDDYWQLYPILDTSGKKRLKRTCNDVVRETQQAKEWPRFPPNAVAIGSNCSGDLLAYIHTDQFQKLDDMVYWWDHETGELHIVADDFLDLT